MTEKQNFMPKIGFGETILKMKYYMTYHFLDCYKCYYQMNYQHPKINIQQNMLRVSEFVYFDNIV